METDYTASYGSDWTRKRPAASNLGTDFDASTEVGSSLSRSTTAPAPAIQRLSFARHPSVLGSSLNPTPLITKIVRPVNQNTETGVAFRAIATNNLQKVLASTEDRQIDVQAVLDGSTSKPLGFSDFKRFLAEVRRGAYREESNSWLDSSPILVDFLLDFKRYAEGFSRSSLRDQSKSPHPFEIICYLNAPSPQASAFPLHSDQTLLNYDEGTPGLDKSLNDPQNDQPKMFGESSEFDTHDDNTFLSEPNPRSRPGNRKVNWAPSVKSNNQRYESDLDCAGSTLSTTIQEASILSSARKNSKANSQLSSEIIKDTLKGVEPQLQPLRSCFDTLVSKYLGSTSQTDGLLLRCDAIQFESIQRAILEGKYTTHPAVLSGIVAEILEGLNQHVLAVFLSYATTAKKSQINSRSKTLWGSLILLIALIFDLLLILVPSPLMHPFKFRKQVPRAYRLILFPLLWLGLGLILRERSTLYCLLCWNNDFRCTEFDLRETSQTLPTSFQKRHNKLSAPETQDPNSTSRRKALKHDLITCIVASLVLATVIQTVFLVVPFLA